MGRPFNRPMSSVNVNGAYVPTKLSNMVYYWYYRNANYHLYEIEKHRRSQSINSFIESSNKKSTALLQAAKISG